MDRTQIATRLETAATHLRGWRNVQNPVQVDARRLAYMELAAQVRDFGLTALSVAMEDQVRYRAQAAAAAAETFARDWYTGLAAGIEEAVKLARELHNCPTCRAAVINQEVSHGRH